MRSLLFAMVALLTIAPLAVAQESNETPDRPDDAAWVEDCPPDMMCAATTEEKAPEEGADDGRVYKDGEPIPYGNETCIECSGPAPSDPAYEDGSNCMDGQQEGETCRGDVYYMTPPEGEAEPTRGPSDGSCEFCRGEDADPISAPAPGAEGDGGITSVQDEAAETNDVPAAGLGVILAAFAVAIALVVRKL